jgi:hypothetical protein
MSDNVVDFKRPSIVSAMSDPRLFGRWFAGETWDAWRTILKAAFALPMGDDELAFFHTVAERSPPKKRVTELWVVGGRRGGKDSVASLIAAHAAVTFGDQGKLRPGERALCAWLAYDKDQARIISDYCRGYFAENDRLAHLVKNDDRATILELNTGVDIAVMTSNFRSIRGRPILVAVMDELAVWRDADSKNPDVEVYNAIVPGLATIGGMLIAISTPYRRNGLLWDKYREHFGKNDDDVLVIKAPTRVLNPTIPQEIIDRAIAKDPAAQRAEWLCEFRDDIGGWLQSEIIERAVDHGVSVRPPNQLRRYNCFVDASGGASDSFAAAIAHADGELTVLDALMEIPAPFNPDSATAQICAFIKSYGLSDCMGDYYGAEWVSSAFAKCGIHYKVSDRNRSEIYLDCLPLFMSGRARLLDNRRLVSQFSGLVRTTNPMGRDKVDHGKGGRDDCCNAAAGALVNVVRYAGHGWQSCSLDEVFRASNPDNWPQLEAEENYAEAEAAAGRGELKGAQLRWFFNERLRRAGKQ